MTVGEQLSIFDELADIEDERPIARCPHCLYSWRIKPEEQGTWLAEHEKRDGPWADVIGNCANQRIRLWWVQLRASQDLTRAWVAFKTTRPSDVQYGGNELLWTILEAKRRGCSDQLIQQAIDEARPKKEMNQ